jgi:DNA polymerase elongation subunit (family B)
LPRLSLEVIASHELGEGKVEHDEYESMEEFFLTDYDKFMTYGVKDVELLVLLDRKLKFIDTVKMIAYKCGVNLTDVMGTLKQWQSFMYNEAFYINKILPVKQQFNLHDGVYVGGWVKSVPGKYDWVASFDFSSLYPNAIRAINIGVDTLIKNIPEELLVLKKQYFSYYTPDNEEAIKSSNNSKEELFFIMNLIKNKEYIRSVLEKYNVVVSPNGKFFTKKETSLLADLMGRIYSDRKEEQKAAKKYKKLLETEKTPEKMVENRNKFEYHDVAQYTLKIMMNSCYGSTSLAYNPFSFGENMATSITSTGRMLNRWVAFRVNSHINKLLGMPKTKEEIEKCYYTIQSDTDSNYFKIDDLLPLVEGTESEKTKKIVSDILQPVIEKAINEVIYTLNAINPDNSIIAMEHETLADKFISVADKRYYCRYMSDNKPKHKITGLSLIGKSTPKWSKEKLKPVLDIILDKNSNSLVEYIESVREEFKKAPIGDICSIKSLSSVDYPIIKAVDKLYNTSGNSAPFHSRGAIYHNKLNKEMALGFKDISPKDKVYYAYLVLPNPTNQNAISFINPDFMYKSGLIKYVDYNTLFEKNFTKNILLITDPIKWSLNKYQNLFDDWS